MNPYMDPFLGHLKNKSILHEISINQSKNDKIIAVFQFLIRIDFGRQAKV